jgi:protein tyrosine phosphatase (PTP) superfamily phosphohydrolase (DUF442 family)
MGNRVGLRILQARSQAPQLKEAQNVALTLFAMVSNKVCPLSRSVLMSKANQNTLSQGRQIGIALSTMILSSVVILLTFLAGPIIAGDFSEQVPPNFSRVEPWLYRGGRPDETSVNYLASIGVKTIINLERGWFSENPLTVQKERRLAKKAGLQFIHIPLHPFFKPGRKDIDRILLTVINTDNHPVFVHCRKGSDRTGIVVAALRIKYQRWTINRAYEEMKSFGYKNIRLFWWKTLLHKIAGEGISRSIESASLVETDGL